MENKNVLAKPAMLTFFSVFAAALAIAIVYVCFIDEFLHSLLFTILYLLLFFLTFIINSAFIKGQKELVKISAVSIFTTCLIFHAMAFVDMLSLNYYYFFNGNILITCVGLNAILLFVLFVIAYINHFIINKTNESNTVKVNANKIILIIIAILSLVQAGLIFYKDYMGGRAFELYLMLSYVMFFFISMMLICIEGLINIFRTAREEGKLAEVATKMVGKKAAETADSLDKPTKATKKTTTKKSTKKTK